MLDLTKSYFVYFFDEFCNYTNWKFHFSIVL